MVFLKRSNPVNPKKRPAAPSQNVLLKKNHIVSSGNIDSPVSTVVAVSATTGSVGVSGNKKCKGVRGTEGEEEEQNVSAMVSLLAEAGCTIRVSGDAPPSVSADIYRLRHHIEFLLSKDPSILPRFLSGFSSYIQNPQNLRRVLIPSSHDGGVSYLGESLARVLLLVAPIQSQILNLLLEKLPEHFNDAVSERSSLKDDIARLIINQLQWLDFLVDSELFTERLMDILSISPPGLKKGIIGLLPEIIGEKSHCMSVSALEKMLVEDSEIIAPVLDCFNNMNLNEQLQEQVVTIALSCIRTVNGEHMPFLIRFLLLSTTPTNAGRIITHIRKELKLVGVVDPFSSRNKLKGKSFSESTEAIILDALRSSLRFKNVLCEAVLKELKSLDQPNQHKVIDLWFLLLIYNNGGSLQKDALNILKKKILDGCFCEALFDQCIAGHRELVKDYFPSLVSISEYLLSCKEEKARHFSIYLYITLFEVFKQTYSRQEVLGALVTHIGSGIAHEVSSALETLILLSSKYSEELIPIASHITGILDYMESFQEDSLHKVYEVFSHLAFCARTRADTNRSSIANEVLMIIRKQVNNADLRYRKMGVIGTLKVVSTLGGVNAPSDFLPSQKSYSDDALELLQLSLDSCKLMPFTLIILYDELIVLLEERVFKPEIIEWIGRHTSEFEPMFLSDLEGGQLPSCVSCDGLEGELWLNLDGDVSPIYVKILQLLSSSLQRQSDSLQILPSQFLLLSVVERLSNQGSLGGIDALLGCPLQLPSPKYFSGVHWKELTKKQRKIVCFCLFYAINWIRELLNAFTSQISDKVESVTPNTKDETVKKLLKRLRSLVVLESILNAILKACPLSFPSVCYSVDQFGLNFHGKKRSERILSEVASKKKQKHNIHAPASGSCDPYGKLKQPTIIDALKKAGVRASQEGSDEGSPKYFSREKTLLCDDYRTVGADEIEVVDIAAELKLLDAQRFKFRPLNIDSLCLLNFSKLRETCCIDPAAELPVQLYLLRELSRKLNDFSSSSKHHPIPCLNNAASRSISKMTSCEFLTKIKPIFGSLRKHLDIAVSILCEDADDDHNHWKSQLCSSGIPDLSNLVVTKTSIASSLLSEVLQCYSRILCIDELYNQENFQFLKDLLYAFQSSEVPCNFFSRLQQLSTPENIDYLYCGVYSFLESVLEKSLLLSFFLASEVLVALQSLLNSMAALIKSLETKWKNAHVDCYHNIIDSLRNRLATFAHKLLVYDCSKDSETELKSCGEVVQKILKLYLANTASTSDLLIELGCSILPQVPSCKTNNTQDVAHGFPTLCPTMFHIWYRVLHEENINFLSKLVREVKLKRGGTAQSEVAERMLINFQQSVNVLVSLISLCKVHDKVAVHAMAVKYGGKYVDLFLKAFDFLQAQFQSYSDLIIQMFKEFQKATRVIQALCSEAKGSKRAMITSKVPATRRSMEKLLFHVKALLHNNTSSGCTFWMGNLKHKNLYGEVVSSQLYGNNGDDEPKLEPEPEPEPEPDENESDGSVAHLERTDEN